MAYYIKANSKVAEYVGARERRRRQYPDGNWCLWPSDLSDFGLPCQLDMICAKVGAAKLTMMESKQEFEGQRLTALPEAQEERFRVAPAPEAAPEVETAEPEATAEPLTTEPTTAEPEPEEEAEA